MYTLAHISSIPAILLYCMLYTCTHVQMSSVKNVPHPPNNTEKPPTESAVDKSDGRMEVNSYHGTSTLYIYTYHHLCKLYYMQDLGKFQQLQIKDN